MTIRRPQLLLVLVRRIAAIVRVTIIPLDMPLRVPMRTKPRSRKVRPNATLLVKRRMAVPRAIMIRATRNKVVMARANGRNIWIPLITTTNRILKSTTPCTMKKNRPTFWRPRTTRVPSRTMHVGTIRLNPKPFMGPCWPWVNSKFKWPNVSRSILIPVIPMKSFALYWNSIAKNTIVKWSKKQFPSPWIRDHANASWRVVCWHPCILRLCRIEIWNWDLKPCWILSMICVPMFLTPMYVY